MSRRGLRRGRLLYRVHGQRNLERTQASYSFGVHSDLQQSVSLLPSMRCKMNNGKTTSSYLENRYLSVCSINLFKDKTSS
ncbi:hypothetical protein V3C99_014922 [Haemonchus contortus]